MRRIGMTLVVAGLSWFWPACAGRSEDVAQAGKGGTKATAASGAGGIGTAQGGQSSAPSGSAKGGTAATSGGSGPDPSVGGAPTSTSNGGEATAGSDAMGETGGAGGDSGGWFDDDPESSTFASNVLKQLDGFMFLAPCEVPQDERACYVTTKGCPQNDDPTLNGLLLTDRTLQLGGNPALTYELTLHIQGVTEAKSYKSGTDQNSSGTQLPADGLYTDGTPDPSNARDVFMIRVGAPAHDYFLNAIATESDTRIRYSVFPVDYTAKIRVQGGTTVRLVASDSNCSISRNCSDSKLDACIPLSAANLELELARQIAKQQPYDGQFLGIVVKDMAIVQ